ncbi:dihydrofolate reductase [Burkholderia glumae]|uniref:dihydrofolate reductase n=2 Tax=Burkholderia glumae TaxID=337 RepID=UPI0022B7D944|nr:dihydrofolate reductase [Burkholderia glumae]
MLVAAMAANRVTGLGSDIPWRIPREQKRFRELTMNQLVMPCEVERQNIGDGRVRCPRPSVSVSPIVGSATRRSSILPRSSTRAAARTPRKGTSLPRTALRHITA